MSFHSSLSSRSACVLLGARLEHCRKVSPTARSHACSAPAINDGSLLSLLHIAPALVALRLAERRIFEDFLPFFLVSPYEI
jgi:hypothetical protein